MLVLIENVSDYDLKDMLWGGALDTLNTIIENDKFPELMYLLDDLYPEQVEITTINDLLWFDEDFIYELLYIEVK